MPACQQTHDLADPRLASHFHDVSPQIVSNTVHGVHDQFATSPTRDYIPLLVSGTPATGYAPPASTQPTGTGGSAATAAATAA